MVSADNSRSNFAWTGYRRVPTCYGFAILPCWGATDMKRRDFIWLLCGTAVARPIVAGAQQRARTRRIGVVMGYPEANPNAQLQVTAFRQQLQKLGWTEGDNLLIDLRYGADDPTRIRTLATELIGLRPDLMVSNSNLVTAILQSEVRDIPLLFVSVSDPIGSGFVTDLARPTGSVTGFANFQPSMGSKWLELLRQIAPQAERVGLMYFPEPPNIGYLKSAEAAAPLFNKKLVGLPVHSGAEIESVLAAFAAEPGVGLIVAPNVVTFANSDLIVALMARYHVPAIYPFAFYAKAGGLVSYGFDAAEQFRQGAGYVDKILKGAKPADLPVQHPSKFELVINLNTAKALSLDISAQLLSLADEVIQ
jgi:putative ABC transport system substrate-binding protein